MDESEVTDLKVDLGAKSSNSFQMLLTYLLKYCIYRNGTDVR